MIMAVVLSCTGLWAVTYRWTGAAGDGLWSTAENWERYVSDNNWGTVVSPNFPGTDPNDLVVVQASSDITIQIPSSLSIAGFLTFGTNTVTLETPAGTPASLNITTLFVGSSSSRYRNTDATYKFPSLFNYIPDNNQGSIAFSGPIDAKIDNIDSSSWTLDGAKNSITVSADTSLTITNAWNTGNNDQNGVYGRTELINNGTTIVAGDMLGTPECIGPVKTELSDNGAIVVESKLNDITTAYIWTGAAGTSDITTAGNWQNNRVPTSSTTTEIIVFKSTPFPEIPAASTFQVKSINFQKDAKLTIDGSLEINGDFTLSPDSGIDSNSTGTVESTGKILLSDDYDAKNLTIKCNTLDTKGSLTCKTLEATNAIFNKDFAYDSNTTPKITGTLTFTGNDNQLFQSLNAVSPACEIGNIIIDKTGGWLVFQLSPVKITGNVTESVTANYADLVFTRDVDLGGGTFAIEKASVVRFDTDCTLIDGSGTKRIITNAEIKGTVTINPDLIVTGNYTDTGTITTANTINFNGTNQEITASATSQLNNVVIYNGPVKLMSDLSAASLEIKSGANLDSNSNTISLAGNFTNAGTFSETGSLKFIDDATISSSGPLPLSINELITDDTITSDKTLTLNTDISVSALTLKGNATTTNTWTITGSNSIILPTASKNQTGGDYLIVADTLLLKAGTSTADAGTAHYTCTNSEPSSGTTDADYLTLLNNGWILKDPKYFVYKWEGSDSTGKTSWTNPKNWNTNYVPVKDSKVIIQDGKSDYPEITAADSIEIGTLSIGEASSSVATITLSSTDIKLTGKEGDTPVAPAPPLTNYGTIIYTYSGRITNGSDFINDATRGTVEYKTETGIISKTSAAPHYYNLKITSGAWTNTDTAAVEAETVSLNGGKVGGKFQTSTTGSVSFDKDTELTVNTELKTDTISFNSKNITGSSFELTVLPLTTKDIYVGTTETGEYSITNTNLATIKVKNFIIGNSSHTGNIIINESLTGNCGLYLITGGTLSQSNSGAAISTVSGELHLQAAGGIGSITPDKPIEIASVSGIVSAINTGTNDIHLKINNTGSTILGGPDTTLQVIKNDAANGNIKISTAGAIEIGGNIQAPNGNLSLSAAGNITNEANTSGILGTKTTLELQSTASSNGIGTAASPISINTDSVIATTSSGSSGNGIHLVSATTKDSKYKITADNGKVTISHNGKLTVDSTDQIKSTDADITLAAKSYEFKNSTSIDCGTGKMTITAYTSTDLLSLIDSDIGKITTSNTSELIIGDSNHKGNIKLSEDTPASPVTLPAKTTVSGTTANEFINNATINTNDKELNIQTHLINNGTITGSNATITVNRDYSGTGTFTASSDTTIFNRNVDLSGTTFNANNGTVKFNRTSSDSQHKLTVQTDGSTSFYKIEISKYLTCAGEFKISNKWTNNGTFTGTGSTVHFTDIVTVDGTENTTFNNLEIDAGVTGTLSSNLTVAGTTTIANGTGNTLILSGTNSFTGNMILGKTAASVTGGELTINSNSTVTIADDAACDSLSITVPTTEVVQLFGALTTTSESQINGSLTIDSGVTTNVNRDLKLTGDFTDNGTWTDTGSKIIFNGTGLQKFNPNPTTVYFYIDSEKSTGNIQINKNFKCNDANFTSIVCATNPTIDCLNKIIFNGDISVANTEEYIIINGNLETNNAITIAPHLMLNGSFSGDGNATFNRDVYVFSDNTNSISLTPMTITGNLILDSPRDITLTGTINANNIVLYRGNLKAKANSSLYAYNDIILLGADYKSTNPHVENEKLSELTYSRHDFSTVANMPDTTALSVIDNFTGSYQTNENASLFAGKNFYANGVKFTSADSKEWFIDLPDIRNSNNGFAEAYNCNTEWSHVRCHATTPISDDGSIVRLPAYNCTDNGNNNHWLFEDFEIKDAYTIRDNSVYVEFNHPIRNINNEVNLNISDIKNSAGVYEGIYKDPDCQTKYGNEDVIARNPTTNNFYFYMKSPNSWKTDATGDSAGDANSSDRNGNKIISVIPYVDYSSNHNAIVNVWGKRLSADADNDGNLDSKRTSVTDHTGPVLHSVDIGQELHETPTGNASTSQHSYDAHNYIEFRYSEPVDFIIDSTDTSKNITGNTVENIQVTQEFGLITNNSTDGFVIAGIGTIEHGKIVTGKAGTEDSYVNSLYRKDDHTIRISIAGYTEGVVTDYLGKTYKNWTGYIKEAVIPSGKATIPNEVNEFVIDRATTPNKQISYAPEKTVVPTISGTQTWDISRPIFAPLNKIDNTWTPYGDGSQHEVIGYNDGAGSTLRKIEFHVLDNTPDYSQAPRWVTGRGWLNLNDQNLYVQNESYCADIYGGSRPFVTPKSDRTSGGLRFSTLVNSSPAFKYDLGTVSTPSTEFGASATVYYGAGSFLFIGSSSTERTVSEPDSLYFGLELLDTNISLKEQFTISYNQDDGFITDLAGNLLESKTLLTVDKTPPSFDFVLAPVGQDELYMVFVKDLQTDTDHISYLDNLTHAPINITETYADLMPKSFELFSLDSSGIVKSPGPTLQIDTSVPASFNKIINNSNGREFTALKLKLNRNITLQDIENTYIRLKIPTGYNASYDADTGITNANVTFIQDQFGNYMPIYSAHALSDFAINVISPSYAYDEDMNYADDYIMNGLYEQGSWAVHDWNKEQMNYGTLPANHNYNVVTNIDEDILCTDPITEADRITKTKGAAIFLSSDPSANSVSTQINDDFGYDYRIWTPDGLFSFLAPFNNYSVSSINASVDNSDPSTQLEYQISDTISKTWGSNNQITFLYGLTDEFSDPVYIYNVLSNVNANTYNLSLSNKVPLYALRLKNPVDITSLDLWSFKVRGINEQRGGVTVMNNVIDISNGEDVVVKVNMPSSGNLNIMIMTVDGNIISYLNHGELTSGEHYFTWDGKNKNGKAVARGMYFIRISGSGIDETRKVMVVK